MTGGSISWASINESESSAYGLASSASSTANSAWSTASGAHTLANAIKEGTCTGTFINGKTIYSPTIYAGKFYAVNGDAGTYATMKAADDTDPDTGFKIYHSSTLNEIPKIQLTTSADGTTNYLQLGAGEGATGDWKNSKKFIIEQTVDGALLYYQNQSDKFGFKFDSKGVTMLGCGEFNVVTQAYAVFG